MNHFYGTLSAWWPVISPVAEYAEEAAELHRLIRARRPDARRLLELGSGGGHVAHHLGKDFECCLTDLSAEMLAMSRQINPQCRHVQGDMRTIDLGQTFDVVLAHDAIDYMTSEADLARAVDTAWRHLSPGGLVVLVPDAVTETFEPGEDVSGGESEDGRSARLFEWTLAAPPDTTTVEVHYSFLLRDRDGQVQALHERHEVGLFPLATWTAVLAARGFAVEVVIEQTTEERRPRHIFVGHKPTEASQ